MFEEGIKLKVAEAYQEDVYLGKVRVDYDVLDRLGLSPGDIIEIEGTRKTYAIADVLYPEDQGLGIIRMDGVIRKNAGVGVGEYVIVRKPPKPQIAKKVVLAPVKKEEQIIIDEYYLRNLLNGFVVTKGDYVVVRFDNLGFFIDFLPLKEMWFKVVSTNPPKGPVIIGRDTIIEIKPGGVQEIPEVTYEDIGGMKDVIQKVRELVELPLRHPEIFERLGIEPPKGVLLYGPPGTGKTLLAKAVANESGAYFISINGPEIVSKYVGESEAKLREIFEEAQKNAPAIIFIDEIDAIAPKRDEAVGEVERRLVAQLLTLMDGLKSRGKVIVIAATNRPNALDPALRRPGRFDREIEVPVPNEEARYEILKVHTRRVPLGKRVVEKVDGKTVEKYVPLTKEEKEQLLRKLAAMTHGFVGADLAALVKEAAMNAIRRVIPDILALKEEKLPKELLEKLMVTEEDFKEALKMVTPSAMREFYIEIPKVKWEDIGGLEEVKQELRETVEWPLKYRIEELGIKPPKGVLLYGPPGTGKTLLAKAAASESGANFIAVKGPEILNKWVGESERAIREIFRKAKQAAPAIIFIDEIDAIAPARGSDVNRVTDRIVNQLLTEMDGITDRGDVIVIGATNRPDILDPALLRPGRFDRVIYVPPPDKKARVEIFKIHARKIPKDPELKERFEEFKKNLEKLKEIKPDIDIEKYKNLSLEEALELYKKSKEFRDIVDTVLFYIPLAEKTEGYTGADIEAVVREAVMLALRELFEQAKKEKWDDKKINEMIGKLKVKMKHFEKALEKVGPSVDKETIRAYEEFAKNFRKRINKKNNPYLG